MISGSTQTAVVYRAPYIGMTYLCGVIFYILQPGDPGYISGETHGLIAATEDQDSKINRSNGCANYNTIEPGATGAVLGTRRTNTDTIVEKQGNTGSSAAILCDDYTNTDTGTGSYSVWYLPSRDGLYNLYQSKAEIGGFTDYFYWSSSESDKDHAKVLRFNGGFDQGFGKCMIADVRAVRDF